MVTRPTDTISVPPLLSPPDTSSPALVVLPSGRTLDLERSRWDGTLDAEELAYCCARGIPLAYDCQQIGWVPLTTEQGFSAHRDMLHRDMLHRDMLAGPAWTSGDEAPASLGRRLCSEVRALARRCGPSGGRHKVEESIAAMVRTCAEVHGLRVANAIHWALQATVDRELPERSSVAQGAEVEFTFRPWRPQDASVYRELLDDPDLWRFLPEPYPAPVTEAMAQALIGVGSVEGRQSTMAVERDGRPIGQCMLRFDEAFAGVRTAEVAYWLGSSHQGNGWMSRILSRFLADSMRSFDCDVVYAWIREDHAASARVAERCGFRRDTFAFERVWAAATCRPGFLRYATYRSQWRGAGGAPALR